MKTNQSNCSDLSFNTLNTPAYSFFAIFFAAILAFCIRLGPLLSTAVIYHCMRWLRVGLVKDSAIANITLMSNDLKVYYRFIIFYWNLVVLFLCLSVPLKLWLVNINVPPLVFSLSVKLPKNVLIKCDFLGFDSQINNLCYLNLAYNNIFYLLLLSLFVGMDRGLSGDMNYFVNYSSNALCRYLLYEIKTRFRYILVLCLVIVFALATCSSYIIDHNLFICIFNLLLINLFIQCRT